MSDTIEKLTLEQVRDTQVFHLQTDLHTDEPSSFLCIRPARTGAYGNQVSLYRLPENKEVRVISLFVLHDLQSDRGTVLDGLLTFPPPTALELLEAAVGDADAFVFRDHMGQAHAARRRTMQAVRHLFRVIGVSGHVSLESILEMFQPDIGSIVVLPKQEIPW